MVLVVLVVLVLLVLLVLLVVLVFVEVLEALDVGNVVHITHVQLTGAFVQSCKFTWSAELKEVQGTHKAIRICHELQITTIKA